METHLTSQSTRERRFDQYVTLLADPVDHADRAQPLHDYCTGLFLPIERKRMEPMAVALAPGNTQAKHQSLRQFIADAPWRDAPVLRAARDYALPALMAHGGVEATLVEDPGLP